MIDSAQVSRSALGASLRERQKGTVSADAPRERIGDADGRKRYALGGIAQVAQLAVADENLVGDVVQRADEQAMTQGMEKRISRREIFSSPR